jgi:2-C-methyl-D-erythritol 2,4-cyclodiphosphate synthase
MRTGLGFDVHRLVEGRKLILGGVTIPHEKGLLGHSDADVLVHAIIDALLGAAALGDIGVHFPDTDDSYKGIDSLVLLGKSLNLVTEAGYNIVNIDSIVMAEKPKIAPHLQSIRKKLCLCLQCDIRQISVKATTTEKLGFVGREEGIAAQAIVLLEDCS